MTPTTTALRLLFYAAVAGVITVSVAPADTLVDLGVWDKAEHAAAYALLALLGSFAHRSPQRPWLLAVTLVTLGIALEIAQTQIAGRVGDVLDASANATGVIIGCIAYIPARRLSSAT